MELLQLGVYGVIGLVTIVAAGAFSARLGIAAPLVLIVVGVGFSYIPGAPTSVPHELILLGLLPPILYAASITVPVVDFRRNFSTISALSVGLVIVTTAVTGYLLYLVFPQLSLAAAIAIGAVISPTDAVAATALGKKFGLPPRLVTIMEGESLVNDATDLVLLRSAIAATATAVSFWDVAGDFLFAVAVAAAIGLAVGFVTVRVRSKITDPLLDTAISFAVPFIAFIPTQFVGASGVLAVVVAGLYSGHHGARRFSAQARVAERLNWRTLQFVLENGVFLLMGVQISGLISSVIKDDLSAAEAVLLGLAMTAVVIVIRFLFVGPVLLLLRAELRRAERAQNRFGVFLDQFRRRSDVSARGVRRQQRAEAIHERRGQDLAQLRAEGLGCGQQAAWRIEAGLTREILLARVQPPPGQVPELLSSNANFLDTLDEIGLAIFKPGGALHVAIGKSPAGLGNALESFDTYHVTLPPSPGPASFANLSLFSGVANAPFLIAPQVKAKDWVLLPDQDTLLVYDSLPADGVLDAIRPGTPGAQPVLGFIKSLAGIECVGRWLVTDIRRSDGSNEQQLWRMPISLAQPAALLAGLPGGTTFSRFAARRDGWLAYVSLEPSGTETLQRAHLPSGALQIWNPATVDLGAALGYTSLGTLALSVDSPASCVTWPFGSLPPVTLQSTLGPCQILPGI